MIACELSHFVNACFSTTRVVIAGIAAKSYAVEVCDARNDATGTTAGIIKFFCKMY